MNFNLPLSQEFDPATFAAEQLGLEIHADQAPVFDTKIRRGIVNCCRQWGKSTSVAARAVHHAIYNADSLTLIVTPSASQSREFLRKAKAFARKLKIQPKGDGDNACSLLFPNGSRLVGLPANKDTSRGFSRVSLLLIDEASRVHDEIFHAIAPSTAAHPDPTIWLMSTPNGRQGFFYRTWIDDASGYTRISVPATQCPRIKKEYLDQQRRSLPIRDFRQEYMCEFHDPNDAVFSLGLLKKCFIADPPIPFPSFLDPFFHAAADAYLNHLRGEAHYFIGLDPGQVNDYTAIAIVERLQTRTGGKPDSYKIQYTLRHVERIPLHTKYNGIVDLFRANTQSPLLKNKCTVIVDATGAGQPIFEMMKNNVQYCALYSINITGGSTENQNNRTTNVPKTSLIASLQLAIESAELKIPRALPHLPLLVNEMRGFKARIRNTGSLSLNAEHGEHDDLLMATALAVHKGITR
jgi:hypothetical protein